jgi:hypothetical protein
MDAFIRSSFGQFLKGLFCTHFTSRSFMSFLYLAYGWSMSKSSHTLAHYIWLSGGSEVKHFSRYYLFLTGSFLGVMDQLWESLYKLIDSMIAAGVVIELAIDDTTRKKSGKKIEGASYYRNGAGSARQEYRSLWGLNFVYLCLSLKWKGYEVCVPLRLGVYLKEKVAQKLNRPFVSRSVLARRMLDFIARSLPERQFLVLVDGGYATKAFLQNLPPNVEVLGRFPIDSRLYELPPRQKGKRSAGRPPKKGASLGNPKDWKENEAGWIAHPSDPQIKILSHVGIWHTVLPGILLRVVAIAREIDPDRKKRTRKKPLEAFFSTIHGLSPNQILEKYPQRWEVEIDFRDANAYYGLGKDRCRKLNRILAINNFRILMAAGRTLWICLITQNHSFDLKRFRPWYRQKTNLSQLDIQQAFDEALAAQGIFPTSRFLQDMALILPQHSDYKSRAA